MMAPITPWLGTLIASELDDVIAWKSIVKPDPGATHEQRSRYSDDGSNLRSVVASSSLDSESTIQLLEKPGSNARSKIPVSDGDVSVLVTLSDSAWDAYDKGLEDGEEARKGDLLLCKKITVVSTTYGPSEERVKLRIEDLELTGNFRKIIGQPTPLLQRPEIITSREQIEQIRLKQLQVDIPMEDHEEDEDMEDDVEDEETGEGNDGEVRVKDEEVPANALRAVPDVVSPTRARPESRKEQLSTVSDTSPRHVTSPPIPSTNSGAQIESQLPPEAMQTPQPPPKPRNPLRRSRGGFSMGREGFELTRGDNLAGPQAPTLLARQVRTSMEPPKNKLLDVMSKLPGQVPRKRSPEPSAPVSAQVVTEEIVVETPTQVRRSSNFPTTQGSTPAPRKRYRIPRDQKPLLDNPSSWVPATSGQEFPHPNVPIELLKAWNAKATSSTNPPSQSSPIPTNEQSPEVRSLEKAQPEPQATAAAEPDDESDEPDEDEDEDRPLSGWSESSAKSPLPSDSSAAGMSPRRSRAGSQDIVMTGSERMPISIVDDARSTSSGGKKSTSESGSVRQETPRRKLSVASQTPMNSGRQNIPPIPSKTPSSIHPSRERLVKPLAATQRPAAPSPNPTSRRVSEIPSSSMRSPALPTSTQSPAVPYDPLARRSEDARSRPTGQTTRKQHPLPPRPSQQISLDPKELQALADNYQGPIRAPTQQTPSQRRAPHGNFYRASQSVTRGDGNAVNDRQQVGATQTPNSTVEMESGAPRPLPRSKYHQDRSNHYRDAQRRQWLELNFPIDRRVTLPASTLLQSYREKYPLDPVTEQEFMRLIEELHPNIDEAEDQTSPKTGGAHETSRSTLAAQAAAKQSIATTSDDGREGTDARDDSLDTHANDVFKEFVSGWKDIRPGGAFSNNAASSLPQQRRLNVLSWGFGE